MKDELTKQCEMAWNRGFQLGIAIAIGTNLLLGLAVFILGLIIIST